MFPLQNIFFALAAVSALPVALITRHLQSSCDIYLMILKSLSAKAECKKKYVILANYY